MKRVLITVGVLLLVVSAVLIWRFTHPPLTDEQQIAANLNAIATAANSRSASGVVSYFSPKFEFNGVKKSDFQRQLFLGMQQYRVVEVKPNNLQVTVQGETATSKGSYSLSLKSEYNSPAEVYTGEFSLKWQKEDGQWKVSAVDGANLPRFSGF